MNSWHYMGWIWTACTSFTFTVLCLLGQPPMGWTAVDVCATNFAAITGGWMVSVVAFTLFNVWRDHRRAH